MDLANNFTNNFTNNMCQNEEKKWLSVGIVGAGPVGLFAAFACGMQGLSCGIMDVLETPGGQCSHLYGEKMIYDIPAHVAISGADLTHQLCEQIKPFHPQWFLEHSVISMEKTPEGFVVETLHKGEKKYLYYKSLFLCSGLGSFIPKKPPLEHLEDFEEKSVFYHVKKGEFFQDKRILIAGGGDSALDWILHLAPFAKELHLVHRREQFRAQHHLLASIKPLQESGKLVVHAPYQLSSLQGTQGQLESIELLHLKDQQKKTIPLEAMICCFGLEHNNKDLYSWPLWNHPPLGVSEEIYRNKTQESIEDGFLYGHPKDGIPINPTTAQTSIKGIYAAGDGAVYPYKKKLIATGFSEAYQGSYHIRSYLFPEETPRFVHSTTKGAPSL